MWVAQYRSMQLIGKKRSSEKNLFEEAIPVKQKTGGWLTGVAISVTGHRTLFDTNMKYTLVAEIAHSFGFGSNARFYLPGIGMSDAGRFLFDQGYTNVVVGDVGEASLAYQRNQLCIDEDHCIRSDLLHDTLNPLADVVVDSSVLDVFLAHPGLPISNAVYGMKRQMTDLGLFICFSMNNQTIFRKLKDMFSNIWYAFIRMEAPQSLRSRTNNRAPRADVSLWICTDRTDVNPEALAGITRGYLSMFLYNPELKDIRNENLGPDRFFNMSNTTV